MDNVRTDFIYYLRQLKNIVNKIEQACAGDVDILQARLHDNMLPLSNQIRAAINFPLRGICPLAGRELASFDRNENSFQALYDQLENSIRYLQGISASEFNWAGELSEAAGFAEVKLPAEQFIYLYILPNFYFHLSMVYAIARTRGVPLSKQDFDGLHQYPPGFSFEMR